jgi:hypothetical protein
MCLSVCTLSLLDNNSVKIFPRCEFFVFNAVHVVSEEREKGKAIPVTGREGP